MKLTARQQAMIDADPTFADTLLRVRERRPLPPAPRLRGLGDVIEKAAKATGVAAAVKAVEKITGWPCGCAGRRDRLNEKFPIGTPKKGA